MTKQEYLKQISNYTRWSRTIADKSVETLYIQIEKTDEGERQVVVAVERQYVKGWRTFTPCRWPAPMDTMYGEMDASTIPYKINPCDAERFLEEGRVAYWPSGRAYFQEPKWPDSTIDRKSTDGANHLYFEDGSVATFVEDQLISARDPHDGVLKQY